MKPVRTNKRGRQEKEKRKRKKIGHRQPKSWLWHVDC
uniref:Uncharacterized protein n=1 Tax=Arundo donax TaxID=35708 RepID=A0A0A8YW67_ARUDO